jgi:hypothetical protein
VQLRAFALTLLLTTLAVSIPSEPWRRGFFEFYTLSWFHTYIAAVVGAFCVLLSALPASRRNAIIVCAAAVATMLPLGGVMLVAGEFVTGNLDTLTNISEAKSPYRLLVERGESESTMYMSLLMLFMAPMLLLNLWWAWRAKDAAHQYAAIVCAMGLLLFQFQYRFNVFGTVPMLLTPLIAARQLAEARPNFRRLVSVGIVALFAVAYLPTLNVWRTHFILGNNLAYFNLQSVWGRFGQLCSERPGLALADIEAGHWIHYHTRCSVLANVFLLTPQHAEKTRESSRLLLMTPQQMLAARDDIRYVLVFHSVLMRNEPNGGESPNLEALRTALPPLERELLGPEDALPAEFKKQWEVRSPKGQIYARLFEIERGEGS